MSSTEGRSKTQAALLRLARVHTVDQLRHKQAGGYIFSFREMVAAAVRQRAGTETPQDRLQLKLLGPRYLPMLLNVHDREQAHRRLAEAEIDEHGDTAIEFYRRTGQIADLERLGVCLAAAAGQHQRTPGVAPPRRRGSRRCSPRSSDDPDPEPEPERGLTETDQGRRR